MTEINPSGLQLSAEQAEVAARRLAIDASGIMENRDQEDDPAAILATYDDLGSVVGIIRELKESRSTVEIDALGKVMHEYRDDMLCSVGQSRESIERIREGDCMFLCNSAESIDDAVRRAEKGMEWEAKEARVAGDIGEAIRRCRREEAAAAGNPIAAENLRTEDRIRRESAPEAVAA